MSLKPECHGTKWGDSTLWTVLSGRLGKAWGQRVGPIMGDLRVALLNSNQSGMAPSG